VQLKIYRIGAIGVLASAIGYGCATPASSSARQGFVLFYRGECKQAATSFENALKSDPDSAEAYYGQGLANACTGQYDAAIADYSSAIRLDPRWRAYRNRAKAYEQKGDYMRALADFNAAIDLRSDDSLIYLQRAHLYARSG
jgi:tetratricopeptide (TPR) repeat protein